MTAALVLWLLTSPAAPAEAPVCVSVCGLKAPTNCAGLAKAEARAVLAFERYVDDWAVVDVCAAINGWAIVIHQRTKEDDKHCPPPAWRVRNICALGFTKPSAKTIELADDDYESNALTHELVHVVDVVKYGTAGHCDWVDRGVKLALREATGIEDKSPADADCLPGKKK